MKFGTNSYNTSDPLLAVEAEMKSIKLMPERELPEFTGGAIGYVGYDCVRFFEPRVPVRYLLAHCLWSGSFFWGIPIVAVASSSAAAAAVLDMIFGLSFCFSSHLSFFRSRPLLLFPFSFRTSGRK